MTRFSSFCPSDDSSCENLPECISRMQQQEATAYTCGDYLVPEQQGTSDVSQACTSASTQPNQKGTGQSSLRDNGSSRCRNKNIDTRCRQQLCEWSYRVVDHFQINRGIVLTAWSFIDRFLATRGNCNTKILKLAAATALHLADKISGSRLLSMDVLVKLGRNEFSTLQMSKMEIILLSALKWHVHPPTSARFVQELVRPLTGLVKPEVAKTLTDHALFLTEISVCDYNFVTQKPSIIAVASILNALGSIDSFQLPTDSRLRFLQELSSLVNMDIDSNHVNCMQTKLW
eukprot:CAMPEP_0195507552 /NCGR_PEP_ID=MMETSP0794_2-20130614/979_1 /TAXON_ID=515487 /ORGANISM="Stephanopyxis turris, Strain CCMP 815" /LENGTH=287 /DNA_ID=CAMNT_0040634275 /DNA_START=63 /DNA_END=923 /DNA_ORIENTATION=-